MLKNTPFKLLFALLFVFDSSLDAQAILFALLLLDMPKLLTLLIFCIVSVVGEFMDIADKQNFKSRCSYMNTKEVKELAKNQRIELFHNCLVFDCLPPHCDT